jgi:ubiquinone/menaquinone biosynthesis C-methylase UbiE
MQLADTWPDGLRLLSFSGIRELFVSVFGKRVPVELPVDMPGKSSLPRYLLQEFHNVPNGNYSNRFSRGYITGFERSMLGKLDNARAWLAQRLQGCESVLDVGTAGGKTARAVYDVGVKYVWGVDPSPYLLKHAAKDHPAIDFIQGVAEDLPFPCERFDGISVCFVFHEIPPKYIKAALKEFHRVLKAGGKVTISEPSEAQLQPIRLLDFITRSGWQRLYFKLLARFVYEPFLESWHKQDKQALFAECGFELAEHQEGMPINLYLLIKRGELANFA